MDAMGSSGVTAGPGTYTDSAGQSHQAPGGGYSGTGTTGISGAGSGSGTTPKYTP